MLDTLLNTLQTLFLLVLKQHREMTIIASLQVIKLKLREIICLVPFR